MGQDRARSDALVFFGATGDLAYKKISPSMFPTVVEQLQRAGLTEGARVVVEKPFGRDLASARALNQTLHRAARGQTDWRRHEEELNQHPQFTTLSTDKPCTSCTCARPSPGRRRSCSSTVAGIVRRVLDLIGPLSDPRAH